jgi:hypothetical protein
MASLSAALAADPCVLRTVQAAGHPYDDALHVRVAKFRPLDGSRHWSVPPPADLGLGPGGTASPSSGVRGSQSLSRFCAVGLLVARSLAGWPPPASGHREGYPGGRCSRAAVEPSSGSGANGLSLERGRGSDSCPVSRSDHPEVERYRSFLDDKDVTRMAGAGQRGAAADKARFHRDWGGPCS